MKYAYEAGTPHLDMFYALGFTYSRQTSELVLSAWVEYFQTWLMFVDLRLGILGYVTCLESF